MSNGLPTPPIDERKPALSSRRSLKHGKQSNRGPKRMSTSLTHENGGIVIDGRHKRVWKACERCRMKKTKARRSTPILEITALTIHSVMVNRLVRNVRTMGLCAQLGAGKRPNTSSFREGELFYFHTRNSAYFYKVKNLRPLDL
jgi:hypothetical protein